MLGRLDQHAAETLLVPGLPVSATRLGPPLCYLHKDADPVLIHRFVASVVTQPAVPGGEEVHGDGPEMRHGVSRMT